MDATDGFGFTRTASVAFGLLAAGTWMLALFMAGMRCDDVCETGGRPAPGDAAGWRQYADSSQWTEIGVLAWVTLALAAAAIVLLYAGRHREALLAVVLHGALSLRLGALVGPEVVVTSFAGAAMVLSPRAPWEPARRDTSPPSSPALVLYGAGAVGLGWLISLLVWIATTIAARMELARLGDAEPLRFESWVAAGLCAAVLVAGAVHVVGGRPTRAALRLGALASTLAALLVAAHTAAVL